MRCQVPGQEEQSGLSDAAAAGRVQQGCGGADLGPPALWGTVAGHGDAGRGEGVEADRDRVEERLGWLEGGGSVEAARQSGMDAGVVVPVAERIAEKQKGVVGGDRLEGGGEGAGTRGQGGEEVGGAGAAEIRLEAGAGSRFEHGEIRKEAYGVARRRDLRRERRRGDGGWWAALGLNQRPLPCQGGALPLRWRPERRWCAGEDSNLQGVSPTSTSSLRVYQFHHRRVACESI